MSEPSDEVTGDAEPESVRGHVAVLEDASGRAHAMREVLGRHFAGRPYVVFDNAPDMVEWLRVHLRELALVSLDHDLIGTYERDGEPFDPGTGRDVANELASLPAACPVIVHSSNGPAASGMIHELEFAGWRTSRVVPYTLGDDPDVWVATAWRDEVTHLLEGPDSSSTTRRLRQGRPLKQ